jgi:2,4'-dihydroxyacetophenone dioxygenase
MKLKLAVPLVRNLKSWAPDPGFQLGAEECPWIPGEPGCWNKFTLFDLSNNGFVTVLKMNPGRSLQPHYHAQPVVGYTLQGRWKYREYDWVAQAGSTTYEAAGVVHTLTNLGRAQMISVFHVMGPHILVDRKGRQTDYADAFVLLQFVQDYCKAKGIDDSFLEKIIR